MVLKTTAVNSGGDNSPFKKSDDFLPDFGEGFNLALIFSFDLGVDLSFDLLFEADFAFCDLGVSAVFFVVRGKLCDLVFEACFFEVTRR